MTAISPNESRKSDDAVQDIIDGKYCSDDYVIQPSSKEENVQDTAEENTQIHLEDKSKASKEKDPKESGRPASKSAHKGIESLSKIQKKSSTKEQRDKHHSKRLEKGDNIKVGNNFPSPSITSWPSRAQTSGTMMPPAPNALVRNANREVLSQPGAVAISGNLSTDRNSDDGGTGGDENDSSAMSTRTSVELSMNLYTRSDVLVNAELVSSEGDIEHGSTKNLPAAPVMPVSELVKAETIDAATADAQSLSIKDLVQIHSVQMFLCCIILCITIIVVTGTAIGVTVAGSGDSGD